MKHYTKEEWDKIPDNYKGRWEPNPYNLSRVELGELPADFIGRRNAMDYEPGKGTVLLTEGYHFTIGD